jgi:hypothetical protein
VQDQTLFYLLRGGSLITKGLSAGDVKAQCENANFDFFNLNIGNLYTLSTSYVTAYQKTLDFTYIEYLNISFWLKASGHTVRTSIGGTIKSTLTNGGNNQDKIDCTAITGDQILLIEIKDADGTDDDQFVEGLSLWSSDA